MQKYKPKIFVLKCQKKISQHFQNGNFLFKNAQIIYLSVCFLFFPNYLQIFTALTPQETNFLYQIHRSFSFSQIYWRTIQNTEKEQW